MVPTIDEIKALAKEWTEALESVKTSYMEKDRGDR